MKNLILDPLSGRPKYKQIIDSIEKAIELKELKRGDSLPSVNKVCLTFSLSRDTVLAAYDELKKRGIIYAILGKGYYIKTDDVSTKQKIFLLFDELNTFKEDLYNSFLRNIDNGVFVDIYFHHFNFTVFSKLINDANGNYSKYIIMPSNIANAASVINRLPRKDVYILDQTNPDLKIYPAVYQNFVKDIFNALTKVKPQLDKYSKLTLVFPGYREPLGMKEGFKRFCRETNFNHEIISEFNNRNILKGEVYIMPNDRDLVLVIEKAKKQNFTLGVDYGIISYNETPLKRVVENGITTISTDFIKMGQILSELISQNKNLQIENDSAVLVRRSL